jgi:hypothetical protein
LKRQNQKSSLNHNLDGKPFLSFVDLLLGNDIIANQLRSVITELGDEED